MRPTHLIAKAILFDEANHILLLQRSQSDPRRPLQWDVPGGWVDENEDFVTAVTREIKEETGISAERTNVQVAYSKSEFKDGQNKVWLYYVTRVAKQDIVLSNEHVDSCWVSLDEALKLIEYPLQKTVVTYINDNCLIP